MKKIITCEQVLADKDVKGEIREVLEKGMKKTDRIVEMRTPVREDGSFAEARILVASHDGKAKVVGYGLGFAGPSKEKK